MSSSRHGTILKSIHYTEQLQQLFADLSGDYNPMHVDAVAARRLMAGERVVHGIHQAFASLEAVLGWRGEGNPPGRAITHFKAEFLKPVVVGDTVDLYLAETGEEGCRITSRIGEQAVSRVTVKFGAADRPADAELPPLAAVPLVELSFADLTNQAGSLVLGLDAPLAHRLFPLTAAALGTPGVAEILALSRLVGMHCPGLHSIFDQADRAGAFALSCGTNR